MVNSVPTSKARTSLFRGLSTDKKPSLNVQAFSLFIEEDTGVVFIWTDASWVIYNPSGIFSAIAADMGATQDLVVVTFSDVPQNFDPIAGVRILVDGVDDLKPGSPAILSGNTLTYPLNSLAPTNVSVVWEYTSPPGIISDGVDLAPSIALTAQSAIPATDTFWSILDAPSSTDFWAIDNAGTDYWDAGE